MTACAQRHCKAKCRGTARARAQRQPDETARAKPENPMFWSSPNLSQAPLTVWQGTLRVTPPCSPGNINYNRRPTLFKSKWKLKRAIVLEQSSGRAPTQDKLSSWHFPVRDKRGHCWGSWSLHRQEGQWSKGKCGGLKKMSLNTFPLCHFFNKLRIPITDSAASLIPWVCLSAWTPFLCPHQSLLLPLHHQ